MNLVIEGYVDYFRLKDGSCSLMDLVRINNANIVRQENNLRVKIWQNSVNGQS
jgi:hypothetical protein